jgi:hypothetical protein
MKSYTGGAARPRFVGNDVVDLEDPRCHGKHLDVRFLERVFAPQERSEVAAAADPARALWLRWAAKEAGYKVVSKLLGEPPPFTHAAFRVETLGSGGTVSYGAHRLPFRVVREEAPLHVVALDADGEGWPTVLDALTTGVAPLPEGADRHATELDDTLTSRFTSRERAAIHTLPSAWVRLEARAQLARTLEVPEGRVEIVCELGVVGRSPPVALLDGEGAEADVSLSHHGRWVGWAVLSRRGGGGS